MVLIQVIRMNHSDGIVKFNWFIENNLIKNYFFFFSQIKTFVVELKYSIFIYLFENTSGIFIYFFNWEELLDILKFLNWQQHDIKNILILNMSQSSTNFWSIFNKNALGP